MVLAFIFLQMAMFTKDNSRMEIGKGKAAILGLTKAIIKVNGLLIR
jgi:hypothetical protein